MVLKDFEIIRYTILRVQVCTSLDNEVATERVNTESPTGIPSLWKLLTDEKLGPIPCEDNPSTHRHLLFEC